MADLSEPHILVVGAGAIGASLAGFLAPRYPRVSLAGRGPALTAIGREGVALFRAGAPERPPARPEPWTSSSSR
jgi:ketopantoate reductase